MNQKLLVLILAAVIGALVVTIAVNTEPFEMGSKTTIEK